MSSPLPNSLATFLQALATEGRFPAYIELDDASCIASWGGSVSHYGVHSLLAGTPAERALEFLTGLIPLEGSSASFRGLEVSPGSIADLHLLKESGRTWVLLLDAGAEHASRQRMQQIGNELALDRERLARRVAELEAELRALREGRPGPR